jgi:peptidoglycan/LPS O-acetylase OafA/YrhL
VNVRAGRFPLFDSLRAIAALSVLLFHAAFFEFVRSPNALRPYTVHLDVGVTVFFLISGFLLYRPFVAARLGHEEPPLARAYAWRRFLRVAPAYWLALIVIEIWVGAPEVFTLDHAPLYFGFAHIYDTQTLDIKAMPQAWTLCVEVSFYVFLPLYAALLRRITGGLRTELIGAAVLFCLGLAYKLWVFTMGPVTDVSLLRFHLALPEYIDYFAIGMALTAISVAGAGGRLLDLVSRRPWIAWTAALLAFVLVSKGIGLSGSVNDARTEAPYLARHYLYAFIALALLLPAVFGDPDEGLIRRVLAWRPLLWIGLVSYGAYLYHFVVIEQLADEGFRPIAADTTPYLWFPVALAGSLAIAAVSWYCFERPILSLKRLVPRRPVERREAKLEPAP